MCGSASARGAPTLLFLSLPAHGHLNPMLPVMAELVQRGGRVLCFAVEALRPQIEATGALFRSYGPDYTFDPTQNLGGPMGLMARSGEVTERLLPSLIEAVRAEQPDCLMLDAMCFWGKLLQQITGLPAISIYTTFVLTAEANRLLLSGGVRPPVGEMLSGLPSLLRYFRIARRLDRTYGTHSPGFVGFFTNEQACNIVFTARDIQPGGTALDARYRFVGPSVAPRHEPVAFPFERLDPSRPLIYISLGTIFNTATDFYRACFRAFADQPYQVVLSIGQTVAEEVLGPPPANVIVRRYVPQLEILARSALFITHGGMNSASEALLEGVPLLIVPQVGDQFIVATHLAALGAGVALATREATADRLRGLAMHLLTDPGYRQQSERLGAMLRAAGGFVRAADEIEHFLAALPGERHQERPQG